MEQIMVSPKTKELRFELPQNFENILILSPGVWNGLDYTAQEIQSAFSNTDWEDKSNTHVYLDHQDTKDMGVANWAGFIRNPRIVEGELRGDLEIWDESVARFLVEAKAKFGVSATLAGFEDEETGAMRNFHFESFSIVTNPACKPAWINLSQEVGVENRKVTNFETVRKRMGWTISKFYAVPKSVPSSSKLPIFDASHVRNAIARFNQTKFLNSQEKSLAWSKIKSAAKKFGIKISQDTLSDNLTSSGGTELNNEVTIMEKKNLEEEKETQEESKESEESSDESSEDESSDESSESSEGSEDSSESDESSKEELSSSDLLKELNSKFDKLLEALAQKDDKGDKEPQVKPKSKPKMLEKIDGFAEIKKQLSEIKEKLTEDNTPLTARRMTLAVSDSMIPNDVTNADKGMLEYLKTRI